MQGGILCSLNNAVAPLAHLMLNNIRNAGVANTEILSLHPMMSSRVHQLNNLNIRYYRDQRLCGCILFHFYLQLFERIRRQCVHIINC
jgi:hypothetical protein